MSAIIEADQTQIAAIISEFTKLKENVSSGIRPPLVDFMGNVRDIAEEATHVVQGRLQRSWAVGDTQTTQGVNVKLFNEVPYAEEEFDRPGDKTSVGTPHDVRPQINDFATSFIEDVVFQAVTKDLRQ